MRIKWVIMYIRFWTVHSSNVSPAWLSVIIIFIIKHCQGPACPQRSPISLMLFPSLLPGRHTCSSTAFSNTRNLAKLVGGALVSCVPISTSLDPFWQTPSLRWPVSLSKPVGKPVRLVFVPWCEVRPPDKSHITEEFLDTNNNCVAHWEIQCLSVRKLSEARGAKEKTGEPHLATVGSQGTSEWPGNIKHLLEEEAWSGRARNTAGASSVLQSLHWQSAWGAGPRAACPPHAHPLPGLGQKELRGHP